MKARWGLGVLAIIGITSFLYVRTQSVDIERNEQVRQILSQLSELSSRLSEDVLKLRCALLTNYDSVTYAQKASASSLEDLWQLYSHPETPDDQAILALIENTRKLLQDKGTLAEEFKSQSAVLENSLDYLPILGYSLASSDLGSREASRLVDDLLRDTFVYNRGAEVEVAERIRSSIHRLNLLRPSLPEERLKDLNFMIAHVETVIRAKPAVDSLLGRMVALPVSDRLEKLRRIISRGYDDGVKRSTYYRRILLIATAGLALAIAIILIKLQQKALALNAANVDLSRSMQDLARKEAETRAILDGAADGILSLDDQGIVRSVNPTAQRMFGSISPSAVGQPLEHFVTTPWETLQKHLGENQETSKRTQDGSAVTLEVILSGLDVGVRKVYIALLQDITERKRVAALKDDFVSTVSHELRTPLTSIRGSLSLIAHGVLGALPPRAKGMLDIAVKNCDRLVGLVNDILDVEKIASGKMVIKMRVFDLSALLSQAAEAHRPFAEACGVKMELEALRGPVQVHGDPDRLAQVIANILSNACKFSPRGETVTMGLSRHDGKARVSIADRGAGIPDEFRSRIFQKFAQAEMGDDSSKKGTGLGLAISKGLVEGMGGTIGYTSERGKGTTFFFELAERIAEPPAQAPLQNRPRVLICEDEPDIALILRTMMDQNGFDTDVALTLEEAKSHLGRRSYTAMTLDLVLPDGHAVPFVRELRKDSRTAKLPLIVVSAYLEEGRRELGGQAFGILDWLEKPISPERLTEALGRLGRDLSGRRPRILHVEDDLDIRQVVSTLLVQTADVDPAGSLREAWEKLKSADYDLLVLDVGLPDGSGLELLPALRKSSSTPIPALIFSAHELSPRTAGHVSAALLKSKTSNEELLRRIRSLLPDPKSSGTPDRPVEVCR